MNVGLGLLYENLVVWCQSRHVKVNFSVCQGVKVLSPDIIAAETLNAFRHDPCISFILALGEGRVYTCTVIYRAGSFRQTSTSTA